MANATDKQGGPFIYAEGQNDAGQPDDTVSVSAHFISRSESVIEDLIHNAELQHRATCWHKGMNSDLVDSKHASYLTDAVNEDDVDHPDLNDSSPAAPSGGLNVKWQVATAQNTDSQTPVSAYVPFSSISTVTAVSTDYVVITDTSDSNNPKRALVSDIATVVAAAPLDAQYVTLATNGTLTNERVLTPGTAIDITDAGAGSTVTIDVDLNELGVGTPAAADTFIFIDADDSVAKKGSAAATLTAIGGASATTALTAAAVLADKAVVVGAAADRTTVKSDFTMTHDGTNVVGLAAGSTISFGANALSTTGTAATAAHTITQATLGNVVRTHQSTATNDDPGTTDTHNRVTTSNATATTLHTITLTSDKSYILSAKIIGVVTTADTGETNAVGDTAGYHIRATVKNSAGTAFIVAQMQDAQEDATMSTCACVLDATGATIRVRVTGPSSGSSDTVMTWHLSELILSMPLGS